VYGQHTLTVFLLLPRLNLPFPPPFSFLPFIFLLFRIHRLRLNKIWLHHVRDTSTLLPSSSPLPFFSGGVLSSPFPPSSFPSDPRKTTQKKEEAHKKVARLPSLPPLVTIEVPFPPPFPRMTWMTPAEVKVQHVEALFFPPLTMLRLSPPSFSPSCLTKRRGQRTGNPSFSLLLAGRVPFPPFLPIPPESRRNSGAIFLPRPQLEFFLLSSCQHRRMRRLKNVNADRLPSPLFFECLLPLDAYSFPFFARFLPELTEI